MTTTRATLAALVSCCAATTLIGTLVAVAPWTSTYPLPTGQAFRYALASVLLLLAMRVRGVPLLRPTRGDVLRLLGVAVTGMAGFNAFVVLASQRADAGAVGAVVGCSPLVLALVPPLRARRRPSSRVVAAALAVVVGVGLVTGFGDADALGLLYAGGALAGEALFSLFAVGLLPRLGALRTSAYACLAATGLLGVAAPLVPGPDLVAPTARELGALVYLAVIATAAAFWFWYRGLARIGPERAGVCVGLVPVSSLLTGLLLGTAQAGPGSVLGCCLVGVGLASAAMPTRRTRERGGAVSCDDTAPPRSSDLRLAVPG
ncbi:MAG: DMT family transporter [Kineosporiaceae bacterium]